MNVWLWCAVPYTKLVERNGDRGERTNNTLHHTTIAALVQYSHPFIRHVCVFAAKNATTCLLLPSPSMMNMYVLGVYEWVCVRVYVCMSVCVRARWFELFSRACRSLPCCIHTIYFTRLQVNSFFFTVAHCILKR